MFSEKHDGDPPARAPGPKIQPKKKTHTARPKPFAARERARAGLFSLSLSGPRARADRVRKHDRSAFLKQTPRGTSPLSRESHSFSEDISQTTFHVEMAPTFGTERDVERGVLHHFALARLPAQRAPRHAPLRNLSFSLSFSRRARRSGEFVERERERGRERTREMLQCAL